MCLHFVSWPSHHFWLRYSQFDIWPWKFKVKVMAKVKADGHIWSLEFSQCVCFSFRAHRTIFGWDLYSQFDIWPWKFKVKVMGKVKADGHIWNLEFSRCVCFSFCGNRTIFGWDIANSIFDLENSRSRSWPRSNPMVTLKPRVQSMCLLLVSWQSDHFWPRYSQFDIWPWKFKVKITTNIDQNLISWSIGQGQQSCQKWQKSKKLFKNYRVDKNLRPAAVAAVPVAA